MKRCLRTGLTLGLLALLMLRSGAARQAAAMAVRQSAEVVFPSLFPFFVVSRLLTAGGSALPRSWDRPCMRILGVPAAGLEAMVLGLCGGYPLGVYTACARYRGGALTKDQALRLLRFSNNTGPAIFFGMVSALLFPDGAICAWLFAVHVLSAAMTALLLSRPDPEGEIPESVPASRREEPMESVFQAAAACARLCACVVFVSVLLGLALESVPLRWALARLPVDGSVSRALVCAAADLPSGLSALADVADPALRFVLCAGAIGWGGACVHLQAAGIRRGVGLRPRGCLSAKALQAWISAVLAFVPARLLFGGNLPLWPAALLIFIAVGKKVLEFLRTVRYNGEKTIPRRREHAVSQKNRAGLRLLRPGGEN